MRKGVKQEVKQEVVQEQEQHCLIPYEVIQLSSSLMFYGQDMGDREVC